MLKLGRNTAAVTFNRKFPIHQRQIVVCVIEKDQKIERVTPQFEVAVTKVFSSHLKPTLSLLNEVFVLTKVPLLVIRLSLGSLKNHKSFPFKSPPHSLPLRHFEEAQIQTYNPFAKGSRKKSRISYGRAERKG